MKIALLLLAGFVGGTLGAMGLGGGTLLMPILTLFLDVSPRLAAWTNLVCFLPVAAVAICIYAKNDLIVWREVVRLLIFAGVGICVVFLCFRDLSDATLRKAFGWLLIVLGSGSLFCDFVGFFKRKE